MRYNRIMVVLPIDLYSGEPSKIKYFIGNKYLSDKFLYYVNF